MKMHPSITEDRIIEAVERQMTSLDDPGLCIECGEEQGGCEPDARRCKCQACGKRGVYGAQELLLRMVT
jgi:hypothetical protein